ncbi:MAG: hypothetical protein OXR64_03035 [Chloroflexota bacterium]|nr:hypothetical protein [Chloroflexota bacterium]MDE2918798.1 hypothetical protein [Chloroflexota bacterium]
MALASGEREPTRRTMDDAMTGQLPPEARGRREADAQLLALLDDLVLAEGRLKAAQALGVNYRTLVNVVESGRLSRRMRDALERRWLADREATTTQQWDELRALAQRIERAEQRQTALEQARRGDDAAEGELRAMARHLDVIEQALPTLTRRVARLERGQGPRTVAGSEVTAPEQSWAVDDPSRAGVVTDDPHPGEEASYGPGMPAVVEWRRLNQQREKGTKLDQVKTRERIMALEIAMIGEYELTLPPDTDRLHPSQREGYLRWRRRALADLQTERARRELRRWVRRVLTFGLWWR